MADELYGGSPDEFVARRTQRVAEARAARDRPLATSIGQLRRPTRSAWMVNLLARRAPDEVRQLIDLGKALADALLRAAGDDLRRLSSQRHAALDTLTRRATELAAEAGHAATAASRQEVTQTLQAALADAEVADLVLKARVTQPVTYAGFGPLDVFAGALPATAAAPVQPAEPLPAAERTQTQPEPTDPARDAAEAVLREAAAAAELAEQEAAQAVDDAEQATRRADELADQVETLREQLAEAEAREREARSVARAARQRASEHQQALDQAQQALTRAQDELADHT